MSAPEGVLVVADRRELRRRVFDVLDGSGCHQIHSARDSQHAAILVEGRPPLRLMVVMLDADPATARMRCAELRALPAGARTPLMAILDDAAPLDAVQLPDSVDAWLPAQRIEADLLACWQRLPAPDAATETPAAPSNAERALRTLLHIVNAHGSDATRDVTARHVFDEMGLDYLAVWPHRGEGAEFQAPLLQLWNGTEPVWPAADDCVLLHRVLEGETVLWSNRAPERAPGDPLLHQLGLTGFVGLPLLDERREVLGAMLAGARRGFDDMAIAEPLLRCAALRFAHGLELARTREQGRAEGLLDALTGLPNRLLFADRLESILREAVRNGECFAVLFVDIDHFKAINDTHGHDAGDQVLQAVTRRLRGSVRASDTVARYAGDEFTVVLRHIIKNDDVQRIVDKILQAVGEPLQLENGVRVATGVSIGVSFFPDDAPDADTLVKHADEAMYAAKRQGRNTFRIYEVSPEYAREHGTALRSRLRHALGNGELRVVYQPQVETATEDIMGMEALVRWEHPELGPISPAVFVPLAEETGLIVPIGEWVLRTACRQAQEWESRYALRLRVGVNLSAVQLMEPKLPATVFRALQETGLDPTLLELEVTESISIKAAPNLVENLQALHRLGCRIAIDDFGTGAASLDYLRKLPADRIKIDQSFVRNIGVDPDDEAIVRATIEMAHRLKRTVVAEGVETEQHLAFLRENGCEELQGYLFSRPLPVASFGRLLAERQEALGERPVPAVAAVDPGVGAEA